MDIKTEINKMLHSLNKWPVINLVTNQINAECYSVLSETLYAANRSFMLIDTDNFRTAIIHSIINNRCKEFKREFCETPLLILDVDPEHLTKDSIQAELAYILSVRSYKDLPTIIISEAPLKRITFPNNSFNSFIQTGGVVEV